MSENQDKLQEELTKIEHTIADLETMRDVLTETQIETLVTALRTEQRTLHARFEGSGAIAQDNSVAAGEGGIAIKGDVQGPITHGSRNIVGGAGGDVDLSDQHVEQQGKYNINIDKKVEGVSIDDQAQIAQQIDIAAQPSATGTMSTPTPAAEIGFLQEQLQTQKSLLAAYQKYLVLASGSEAAKLEVQIGELEHDIRHVENRIDVLRADQ